MIYQHPPAYLLGLEGAALLRAFAGYYDRDLTEARLAEVRALLDSADQFGEGAETGPITTAEGYRSWAGTYDQPGERAHPLGAAHCPVPGRHADVVVCALALTHIPDLAQLSESCGLQVRGASQPDEFACCSRRPWLPKCGGEMAGVGGLFQLSVSEACG